MPTDFARFCERTGADRGVLVVAPHPDDECAGTGGLLAFCAQADVPAKVVVVTDGGVSHPNSRSWHRARIAACREAETRTALSILGLSEPPVFLGLPDADTPNITDPAHRAAVTMLRGLIEQCRPGLVLTTWRREPHCDHRYAYRLAHEATRATASRLAEYFVWTKINGAAGDQPLPGEAETVVLDIDSVRERKRQALLAYESQLGRLIDDDPSGFVLTDDELAAMTGPVETYLL